MTPLRSVATCLLLVASMAGAGCLDAGVTDQPAGGSASTDNPPATGPSGDPSPGNDETTAAYPWTWALTDTDGTAIEAQSFEGSPALLFFMATWCTTCRSQTSHIAAVKADYPDARFVSVGVDPEESDADLERWKTSHGQDWQHAIDENREVTRSHGVRVQSWVVVLDAEGGTVLNKYNPQEAEVRSALDTAIAA